jgi:dihydroxy-acid dehydratase
MSLTDAKSAISGTFDKSNLPSRHVTIGPERAPHRSYLYAMGLTEEQIARPLVGWTCAGFAPVT